VNKRRASRSRTYKLVFKRHEQSIPHSVELCLSIGFGLAAIVFVCLEPYLSVVAIIVSVILGILGRKEIGTRKYFSFDREETVRLYGEKVTARWIARFNQDMLEIQKKAVNRPNGF
jgi:hypothetical protein